MDSVTQPVQANSFGSKSFGDHSCVVYGKGGFPWSCQYKECRGDKSELSFNTQVSGDDAWLWLLSFNKRVRGDDAWT